MTQHMRYLAAASAIAIFLIAVISCAGAQDPVTPGSTNLSQAPDIVTSDADPTRALIGMWRLDLIDGTAEQVSERTLADHYNVADFLLMPQHYGSLVIELNTFHSAGAFAPPAVQITVTLTNSFGLTGWNVRGIVIDDTGVIETDNPDGWTSQWDIGDNIPLNSYINFALPDGSFPDGRMISRTFTIESVTGKLPTDVWFAVDAGVEGPIESATAFPVAAVNGTFRWPGDSAPILCLVDDPNEVVDWVGAASGMFSGHKTFLTEGQESDGTTAWTGTLDYVGGLGHGAFQIYFAAHSPYDIPTLAKATVYVDPGPFPSGPATWGCSQRCYDPARTCRTTSSIVRPLTNFTVRPPASYSGLVLGTETKVVRRIEDNTSIALQTPGLATPEWTKLIGESTFATDPAVGNDGTIFFLEPEQRNLRALYPDSTNRWEYQFGTPTHTDLILTSSPLGGLLITILRDGNKDIAIVAVGTDGRLRWRYDLAAQPEGPVDQPRIAVGPLGKLYYALPTGGVLALDLYGNPLWAYSQSGWVESGSPMVGDDDRVFFLVNSGKIVACVNPDGRLRWTYPVQEKERTAHFPSLSYDGDVYVIIYVDDGSSGDYVAYRKIDGDTGEWIMAVQTMGARGYITHGTSGDLVFVQRDDPEGNTGCCDDFFVCMDSDGNLKWSLNTPGVTQIGAYPLVTPTNTVYVQGPDGMYVVMF
jgi:hypothetical protein